MRATRTALCIPLLALHPSCMFRCASPAPRAAAQVWVIPNSVFSRTVVLNVTRKNREWRFFEQLLVRVQDVHKVRDSAPHERQRCFVLLCSLFLRSLLFARCAPLCCPALEQVGTTEHHFVPE